MPSDQNADFKPFFSIVISTHNRCEMLKRALHSIAVQKRNDIEVIIVDDATPGGCQAALHSFDFMQLRLLENETRVGPAVSRNRGVNASQARFVAFLDDDDEYLPGYLDRVIQLIKSVPSIELLWTGVEICDEESSRMSKPIQLTYDTAMVRPEEAFLQLFSIGIGFGVMVRRETFLQLGGFDEQLSLVEDTEFFLRVIAADCQVTAMPGVNVRLHNHAGARMTNADNHRLRLQECLALRERYQTLLSAMPALAVQLDTHIESLGSASAAAMTGFLAYPKIPGRHLHPAGYQC